MAGYSGSPLVRKLGIKEDHRLMWINAPAHLPQLLGPLPEGVVHATDDIDVVHFFTNSMDELHERLPQLMSLIKRNGMIWVSWYKKSSKKPSEISEGIIRNAALAIGLVDVKVCAVDEDWSGLKLVIRKIYR